MKKTNEKGITLIALVVTVIVLLILAAVSIAMLTGKNGILSKASTAKEKHLIAQYEEELNKYYEYTIPKKDKKLTHAFSVFEPDLAESYETMKRMSDYFARIIV